jgi:hypothetical protein
MTDFRLIAPASMSPGSSLQFSDGQHLTIPANGIVTCHHANHAHVRDLLAMGFAYAPAAGATAERPAGRFDGQEYFDVGLGKPLWFSRGAWRDATGAAV